MNEIARLSVIVPYLMVWVVGGLLGLLYFGGLWWTVRRLPAARNPWLLYFASLLARILLVVSGFFAVLQLTDAPRLCVCLVGFVLARLILTHWLGGSTPTALSMPSAQSPSTEPETEPSESAQPQATQPRRVTG